MRFAGTFTSARSSHPRGESGLDGRAGLECTQHQDRCDRGAGQLRRHVVGYTRQAQYPDIEHPPARARGFKIFPAVVPKSQVQALSRGGLLDHLGMPVELIADCRANEIGPIRIESLLDHQVDVAEVDIAEIDRDLLGLAPLWAQLEHVASHHCTILLPSQWMVYGVQSVLDKAPFQKFPVGPRIIHLGWPTDAMGRRRLRNPQTLQSGTPRVGVNWRVDAPSPCDSTTLLPDLSLPPLDFLSMAMTV